MIFTIIVILTVSLTMKGVVLKIFKISQSWSGTIKNGRIISNSSSNPKVVMSPHYKVSFKNQNYTFIRSYLDSESINSSDYFGKHKRDTQSDEMIKVHKAVKPVNGIFKHLFDQNCKPEAIKLRKEACKDGYLP